MAKNTIKLKDYLHIAEEYEAVEIINPGDLVTMTIDDKVKLHDGAGGSVLPMFAVEDEFQGKGIDDQYETGSKVQVWIPQRGDQVQAILHTGESVQIGDYLQSNGDGTLSALSVGSSGPTPEMAVGIALENLDLTASGSANARIVVRIK